MSESTKPIGIGIVGAGVISEVYMRNLSTMFPGCRLVAVSDIVPGRAERRAAQFPCRVESTDELLADPEVDLVVCLTEPVKHSVIGLQALANNKHFYTEKPFAVDRAEGRNMLDLAREKGLYVGSAPDTFMGGGLQQCRQLIDQGLIGRPIQVTAAIRNHGMEAWHPDPGFFFQPGAGPLFDVGVYYVTAMATILGPYASVMAMAGTSFPTRTLGAGENKGQIIPVDTPTNINAVMEFESGVLGTLTASFDLWETDFATLTIYGTEGTLRLPDPNTFGGPIFYLQGNTDQWVEIPVTVPHTDNSRGLGANDIAESIVSGRTSRMDGSLGYHVLDFMTCVLESAQSGQRVAVESSFDRPAVADYASNVTIPAEIRTGIADEVTEMVRAAAAATSREGDSSDVLEEVNDK